MKYIDVKTVVESYKGFQDCMTNKSWGYLALLKGCNGSIRPLVPYEVNMDIVSNFLEGIFNLSQTKRRYDGGRSLYVVFSNKWEHYFNDQGRYSPNIYDVAVWAYRRKAFPDDITEKEVLEDFAKEFNIPFSIIKESFNTQHKSISFTNALYSEKILKSELDNIGVDVSKDNIDAKKGGVVASPGEISRGPFVQTLYAGLDITDYVLILQSNYNFLYGGKTSDVELHEKDLSLPLQQIFYGAPGTGKSHKIKGNEQVKNAEEKKLVFRTTFHPDSDYSTFVGAYKPTMKPVDDKYKAVAGKDEEITYSFVPQAFLQSYVAAWKKQDEKVFLIIEEINRGNCVQIFGDLFQLLDRDENGVSEYKIKADADIKTHLEKELGKDSDGIKDGELCLPKNLYIWATMNTSDQSLFPIDSAFKRRWDWKYVKIKNEHKDWKVDIDIKTKDSAGNETTAKLDWYEFIDKINEIIASMTSSADKQLGYFFCKPKTKDSKEIDAETFVSKVIFYLWNDVFKDYAFEDASLFQYTIEVNGNKETKDLTFPDFYNDDESINTTCLTDFIEKVMNWKKGNEDKE